MRTRSYRALVKNLKSMTGADFQTQSAPAQCAWIFPVSFIPMLLLISSCLQVACAPKGDSGNGDKKDASFKPNWSDNATLGGKQSAAGTTPSGGGECSLAQNEDIFKILNECGIENISDKKKKTLALRIPYQYTRVINAGVARAIVPLTGVLNLDSDLLQSTLNVEVLVSEPDATGNARLIEEETSQDGCSFTTIGSETQAIKNRAVSLTKGFIGPVINELERGDFKVGANFHPKWRGIQCTILGAIRLTNKRGGYTTVVEFDTPYVPNISPIATKARYEKELGDFKVFRNIGAKVVATDNPVLKVGKTYVGNIVVEKVPERKDVIMNPSGQRRMNTCTESTAPIYTTILGDTAYRVSNHFGTDEETLAIGFHLWTEYYIDHNQRNFSAVIANVGDDDLMNFIGKYTGSLKPNEVPSGGGGAGGGENSASLSFARDIQPIVNSCAGCHGSGGRSPSVQSYNDARNPSINAVIQNGSMPPSCGLSDAQKRQFAAWVAAGYPN